MELQPRYSKRRIAAKYRKDAQQLIKYYRALSGFSGIVVAPLLGGGMYPGVDLTRWIQVLDETFPYTVNPIFASRYGNAMTGRDEIQLVTPRPFQAGDTVLLVDDIIDAGLTFQQVVSQLNAQYVGMQVDCYALTIREGCRVPENVNLLNVPLPLPEGAWGIGHGMSNELGHGRGLATICTIPLSQ